MQSSNSFRKIFTWIVIGVVALVIIFLVVQKIRNAMQEEAKAEQAAGQKVVAGEAIKRTAAGESIIQIPKDRLADLPINVTRAAEQTFASRVTLVGEILARPNSMVDVSAPVAGRLLSDSRARQVSMGDAVERGEILGVVENLDAGLQDVTTETRLQEAQQKVAQAKIDLDRAEALYKVKAVALKDVQQARLNLQIAENDYRSFQQQNQLYRSARWTEKDVAGPGRFFIRAPLGGVVTASSYRPGQSVAANQPLVTIADVSSVAVQGNVFYETLSAIHRGEQANVRVAAYPDQAFAVRLQSIADTVDPVTKTVRVLFIAANPHRQLKIGMPATIEIETAGKVNGILVPASCVISEDNGSTIYVRIAANQFVRRTVVLGERIGDQIEIKSGLKAGEEYVSQGAMSIKAESQRRSLATGESEEEERKKVQ